MSAFVPDSATLIAYSIACFVLFVTPGPDMSLFLAKTVAGGRRAGIAAMTGASLGCILHALAAALGISALIAASRADCDVTVVSIFVNPAQFNDPADLAAYPRDLDRDAEVALAARADVLFCPSPDDMYPADLSSWVDVAGPAVGLEGERRPGHFRGVATVCLKLFSIVQPDRAYFGQKDAQQVAVIRQMVRDLNLPLAVHVIPTVREPDGLALSSRNVRLSPIDRGRAADEDRQELLEPPAPPADESTPA